MTSTVGNLRTLDSRGGVKRDRTLFVTIALLFLSSTAATIYLCRSMSGGMPMPGGWTMSMPWMKTPDQTWPGAAGAFLGCWLVMMAAMMLPSFGPMLSHYRRAVRRVSVDARLRGPTILVGFGYFCVWAAVGAAAYVLGASVAMAAIRWPAVARLVPTATGVLVLLAAFVQLTRWKARELECCRNPPLTVPLSADHPSAWRHGVSLGVHCTLCCASLMTILLALGIMDLGGMTLVAAAIAFERITPWPVPTARMVGLAALATGVVVVARALFPG